MVFFWFGPKVGPPPPVFKPTGMEFERLKVKAALVAVILDGDAVPHHIALADGTIIPPVDTTLIRSVLLVLTTQS